MSDIILQTKIIPEKSLEKTLRRSNLLSKLKENLNKKLILLNAGAGYGKTTTVKEFLRTNQLDYSWYKIDESDENIYIFFSYIINSIARNHKGFGESSLRIIDSIKSRTNLDKNIDNVISTLGGTFINEFVEKIKDNVYLVLDDVHLLPGEDWAEKSLTFLINNSPENLHFIITSREAPAFDVSVLEAKRRISILRNKDLKFTSQEVRELGADIYDTDIKEHEMNLIEERFDGWITGLHLYLQADRGKSKDFINESKLPESLFNFFAEDIYNSEDEKKKNFLLNTSMLDDFTAGDCDFLFENGSSKKILDELYKRNVFIDRTEISKDGKQETAYNYKTLFKDFLRLKFSEAKSEEDKSRLLKKFGDYYLTSGDYNSAIKYLLLAGEHEKGIELIIKNIEKVGESNDLLIAERWINSLPGNIQEENPYIIYYKGCHFKNINGNLDKALEYFQKCLDKFTELKNEEFAIKSNTFIAEILIKTGEPGNAIKILEPLLKKKISPEVKAKVLYWLADAYNNLADYEKTIKYLERSLEVCNIENLTDIKFAVLNHLGNIYLVQGDYKKSLFYYEKVINHITNIYNRFQTLTNLVQLYAYSGEYEKAKEVLDETEKSVNLYSSSFFKISYLLSSAYLNYMVCDYEKSIETWKQLLENSQKNNISYYVFVSYYNIALCNIFLKKFSSAKEYLELANELVTEFSEDEKINLDFWNSLLQLETGQTGDDVIHLKKAHDFFSENKMMYDRVQSGLHLGAFLLREKKYEEGSNIIESSLSEGKEKEYLSIFQKEILFKRDIFDFAVENKIDPEFMHSIYAGVLDLRSFDWVSPEYKKRLKNEIESFYDIKLNTFGKFEIKIRGSEIEDNLWVRKTRKLIFTYILLNHTKNLNKDNLLDLFYPDSSPENAENNFHQALSNIRSAIKKTLPLEIPVKNKEKWKMIPSPDYLTYQSKVLRLNPDYLYFIDVFEFEKLYKKGMSENNTEVKRLDFLKEAEELYKGDFLEGFYESWVEELRDKYLNYYEAILKELTSLSKKNLLYKDISLYAGKMIKQDNLNEDAYLDLIEAEIKLENVTNAKNIVKQLYDTFEKELGEKPSQKTSDKIKDLLIDS